MYKGFPDSLPIKHTLTSRITGILATFTRLVLAGLIRGVCLMSMTSSNCLAQVPSAPVVPTGPLPTDVTPIRLREERELFQPGPTFYMFKRLPSKMWFNATTETNLRFESNIFLNANNPKRDIVYRALPNVTVGYNFLKNTGVYANYFVIKDVYGNTTAGTSRLTDATTQSLSLGLRHTKVIGRTGVQFDFQARELWQTRGLRQFDYIPGMLVTRSLTPKTYGFVNLQLQMRGGTPFVAPTREIDPFYTVGILRSLGVWTLTVTDTFLTNFRDPPFHNSVPNHGNVEMIADIELYRPILRRYPNLVGFVRAEPIWNWRSAGTPGLSGFDFRCYSGVRLSLSKPAIGGLVDSLRQELKQKKPDIDPNIAPQNTPTTIPPTTPSTTIPPTTIPPTANPSESAPQPTNSAGKEPV